MAAPSWFRRHPATPQGEMLARGICDGPDEDDDKLRLTLAGAISLVRGCVVIVTLHFLPHDSLLATMSVAAKRGVPSTRESVALTQDHSIAAILAGTGSDALKQQRCAA